MRYWWAVLRDERSSETEKYAAETYLKGLVDSARARAQVAIEEARYDATFHIAIGADPLSRRQRFWWQLRTYWRWVWGYSSRDGRSIILAWDEQGNPRPWWWRRLGRRDG